MMDRERTEGKQKNGGGRREGDREKKKEKKVRIGERERTKFHVTIGLDDCLFPSHYLH